MAPKTEPLQGRLHEQRPVRGCSCAGCTKCRAWHDHQAKRAAHRERQAALMADAVAHGEEQGRRQHRLDQALVAHPAGPTVDCEALADLLIEANRRQA